MTESKTSRCLYEGINVHSNCIELSQNFCEQFVRENRFVAPEWDDATGILKLTFYPSNSDVGFRIPLTKHTDNRFRVNCAKFFSRLRQFKMGRYEVFDVDLNRAGTAMTLKFKLEKR